MTTKRKIFIIFSIVALSLLTWHFLFPQSKKNSPDLSSGSETKASLSNPPIPAALPSSSVSSPVSLTAVNDRWANLENKIVTAMGLRLGADRISLKVSETMTDIQIVGLLIDDIPLYPYEFKVRSQEGGEEKILDFVPDLSGMLWPAQRFPSYPSEGLDFVRSAENSPAIHNVRTSTILTKRWAANIDENIIGPQLHVRVELEKAKNPSEIWIYNWKDARWVFERATPARRR